LVCVGAFYFSNNVLPIAQTKLWTLIFSLREKSPEFDIPAGEFYDRITGINLYVREKDKGLLKNLMIYDFSNGFENATVMVADSGRVKFSADNKFLLLSLYNGESFENLKNQQISNSPTSIPYRREIFTSKEILLDFDNEFNRYDESLLQDQHVRKNVKQLTQSIDSVSKIADARSTEQGREIVRQHYFAREEAYGRNLLPDSSKKAVQKSDPDSLFLSLNQQAMTSASEQALVRARTMKEVVSYNKLMLEEPVNYVLRHRIERHRKFTLSFACLIFFFIGAPLGAIIKKGGLGAPIVISVILFIFYYIIDNTGFKMAREGLWVAYEGMWLSSAVLLPIGIFLTYKAVVDATLFNPEEYVKIFNKIKRKANALLKINLPADIETEIP
ncbi:MAG TPA: LptF/LptG family permease, partial [Paludibacter sp.]|nr:LptF/LptG family permease [Paludibacter sp.]